VLENDSMLDLVGMEAGRGARVTPWHGACNLDGGEDFRFRPPAPSRGVGRVWGCRGEGRAERAPVEMYDTLLRPIVKTRTGDHMDEFAVGGRGRRA
jgi:hypothetical protein